MRTAMFAEYDIGVKIPWERMLRIVYTKMRGANEFDHIDLATGLSSYCELWHGGQHTQVYAMGSGIWAVSRNLATVDPTAEDFSWDDNEWIGAAMVYEWLHDNDHANAKKYFPLCFGADGEGLQPIDPDLKSKYGE